MLDVFHRWVGDARVEVAADAAYCNDTVTRGLPGSFVLFGAMRPDAVLTALPDERTATTTGRRRRRGAGLPKPEVIARDARKPWRTCEAELYGRKRKVRYKEVCAQWYRACGVGLLRIVIEGVDRHIGLPRVLLHRCYAVCPRHPRGLRWPLGSGSLLPRPQAGLRLHAVIRAHARRGGARRTVCGSHVHPRRRLVH